jgi:hypothetical protein
LFITSNAFSASSRSVIVCFLPNAEDRAKAPACDVGSRDDPEQMQCVHHVLSFVSLIGQTVHQA